MAVVRIEKTKDYTIMSNFHFKEINMTLKAKGLLSFMLSLPDDWDYSISGLETLLRESRSTIANILKELETFGYLERKQIRDNGKIVDWEYVIYEKPYPKIPYTENQHVENQHEEIPHVENQHEEIPHVENCSQQNTNLLSTKKQTIKKQKTIVSILESVPDDLALALEDFIEMRKKIKAPLTERSLELIISKVNKLSDGDIKKSVDIVNQSIENSWRGVFPLRQENIIREPKKESFSFMDIDF